MKDKLEKFISDNRQQFDEDAPGDEIWGKIDAGIDKPKVRKINLKTHLWRVAAVLLIFIASYFLHDLMQRKAIEKGEIALRETNAVNNSFRLLSEKQTERTPVVAKSQNVKTSQPTYSIIKVVADDNNELPEVTAYYAAQIAEKEKEIYNISATDPKIKTQIKTEFIQLDCIYSNLRRDIKDNINNREIVEAMIQNYRMRLELLENILQQLKNKDSQASNRIYHE